MCCFAVNDVIHGSSRDIFCELNDLHSLRGWFLQQWFQLGWSDEGNYSSGSGWSSQGAEERKALVREPRLLIFNCWAIAIVFPHFRNRMSRKLKNSL